MKKIILSISAFFVVFTSQAQTIVTDTCTSGSGGGNLVVFVNYDGGVLNINVDQNIPNLKIGICTYEAVTINLSGPFVSNVTEVRYAGYNNSPNNNCIPSVSTTSIVGAPGGATTSINFAPPATLSNINGYSSIICGYSCSTTTNQGGCNTGDQIIDYFENTTGGSLYSYFTQYGCWSPTVYNVSAGSNCPFTGAPDTTITVFSSSSTSICQGDTINFTDLSPSAVSWSWTAPGSSIPSAITQNLSNVVYSTPGTYSVTLTVNDGSGTCSAVQSIEVLPLPDLNLAANPNPICPGQNTSLFANGASSYQWHDGGPAASTYLVNPMVSTWYSVSGTDINGCTAVDSVQVIVYPAPAVPNLVYTAGMLNATPTGYVYVWYLDGNVISGVSGSNYAPTVNGMYAVEYTDSNGCLSSQYSTPVNDQGGSGIEEFNQLISISPNPSAGIFQISSPEMNGEVFIEITDVVGKSIYSKNIFFNNSVTLDLSHEKKGTYILRIHHAGKYYLQKLMIE